MGYVPQAMKSDLNIKVMDYILLGRSPYFKFSYSKQNRQIVERVMDEVGVSAFAMRDLKHLSGGERQKVSICRALVQEPEILLLDEPTSALDIRNQIDVLRLLRQISRSRCLTIIMSIHDLSLSLTFSDTALMLYGGADCATGTGLPCHHARKHSPGVSGRGIRHWRQIYSSAWLEALYASRRRLPGSGSFPRVFSLLNVYRLSPAANHAIIT